MLSESEGEFAVKVARRAIEARVVRGEDVSPGEVPPLFNESRGAFTTLHAYPGGELRGCIGYPEPKQPLIEALIHSAIGAANDPRFEPLKPEELEKVIVEVSILTKPEPIGTASPQDRERMVEVGRDGLMITKGPNSGLLLPQVPVEQGWDARKFLDNLCLKAGLPPESWMDIGASVYKFQAQIFSEESPNGPVREKKFQ